MRKENVRMTGKMKVEKLVLSPMQTNCYIVSNLQSKECFVVDMAMCSSQLVLRIRNAGLKVKALLLTHGHYDHILGIDDFLQEFPVPVYACRQEQPLLEDARLNVSSAHARPYTFAGAKFLEDGDELTLAGTTVRMLHTPGHTAGGCCYYLPEEDVVFSGDTLFQNSIGRSDLPTGNIRDLLNSVRTKLFALPDETQVCPGHMGLTSIGHEKKYNPYM